MRPSQQPGGSTVAFEVAASPPPRDGERIFGLDVLRSAAILSVICAHALHVFYPHFYQIGLLGHGGFYGVELFFVLSGFLIGQILIKQGEELRRPAVLGTFYLRRWFRTLPLFWLFIGINVALEWHLHQRVHTGKDIFEHAFFLRTLTVNRIGFITESFSLAIEEWFYLLFPACLFLGLKLRGGFTKVLLTTAAAFYLFSTVGRVLSADRPGVDWTGWHRVIVIYRFDALMTGVIAGWVAHRFPCGWKRGAYVLAGVGALLALAMYASLWEPDGTFFRSSPDAFFARTFRLNLVSLGFALLLPAASLWRLRQPTWWSAAVRNIALWSYSMYLVHQPVIQLVHRHWFPAWKTSAAQAVLSFTVQIGATILISALLYRFFEAPISRLRDRFGRSQSPRAFLRDSDGLNPVGNNKDRRVRVTAAIPPGGLFSDASNPFIMTASTTSPTTTANLYSKSRRGVIPTLLTAAFSLFVAGVFFPFFHVTKLWLFDDAVSVVGGISTLFHEGEYFLFIVLTLFTLVFPCVKLGLLAIIWVEREHNLSRVRNLHRWVEHLGKWSMLDVFVVAILIVAMKSASVAAIHIGLGLYLFTFSVVTTQLASAAVARRLK